MHGRNVRQILTEAQLCRYSLGDFESRRTTVPSRNRRAITQAIEIAQEPLAHARKFRLAFGPVKVGFGAILLKKSLLRELIRGSRNHTSSMAEKAECYYVIYLHQDREFRESSADRLFQQYWAVPVTRNAAARKARPGKFARSGYKKGAYRRRALGTGWGWRPWRSVAK